MKEGLEDTSLFKMTVDEIKLILIVNILDSLQSLTKYDLHFLYSLFLLTHFER